MNIDINERLNQTIYDKLISLSGKTQGWISNNNVFYLHYPDNYNLDDFGGAVITFSTRIQDHEDVLGLQDVIVYYSLWINITSLSDTENMILHDHISNVLIDDRTESIIVYCSLTSETEYYDPDLRKDTKVAIYNIVVEA